MRVKFFPQFRPKVHYLWAEKGLRLVRNMFPTKHLLVASCRNRKQVVVLVKHAINNTTVHIDEVVIFCNRYIYNG